MSGHWFHCQTCGLGHWINPGDKLQDKGFVVGPLIRCLACVRYGNKVRIKH